MPIRTVWPPRPVTASASSIVSRLPSASNAQSTGPIAAAAASPVARTVAVAPSERASSSAGSETSTARIEVAPAIAAAWTTLSPTPPQPITATRSPGRTPAVLNTAPKPVITAQPISASSPSGRSPATGTHDCAGTTERPANVETV